MKHRKDRYRRARRLKHETSERWYQRAMRTAERLQRKIDSGRHPLVAALMRDVREETIKAVERQIIEGDQVVEVDCEVTFDPTFLRKLRETFVGKGS